MACPQNKTSKSRTRKRRSHQALAASSLARCQRCGAATPPHAVCANCGYYRGKPVVDQES